MNLRKSFRIYIDCINRIVNDFAPFCEPSSFLILFFSMLCQYSLAIHCCVEGMSKSYFFLCLYVYTCLKYQKTKTRSRRFSILPSQIHLIYVLKILMFWIILGCFFINKIKPAVSEFNFHFLTKLFCVNAVVSDTQSHSK